MTMHLANKKRTQEKIYLLTLKLSGDVIAWRYRSFLAIFVEKQRNRMGYNDGKRKKTEKIIMSHIFLSLII